ELLQGPVLGRVGHPDEALVGGGQRQAPDGRVLGHPGDVDQALGLGPGQGGGEQVVEVRPAGGADALPTQPGLEVVDRRHGATSRVSSRRRRARPARTFCRAASSLQPMMAATSAYGRSNRKRCTTAVRCLGGRLRTARHRSASTGGTPASATSGGSATGTACRCTRRAWSTTLRWAIVNSQPRRFSAWRSSGYARRA